MDISFHCDKCGQHIVIAGEGAGFQVQCPKCAASLTVPSKVASQPVTSHVTLKPTITDGKIIFECKRCHRTISADTAQAGKLLSCPKCEGWISVPEMTPASSASTPEPLPPSTAAKKKCPFCLEEILTGAVKCKHCGEFLNSRPLERFHTTTPVTLSGGLGEVKGVVTNIKIKFGDMVSLIIQFWAATAIALLLLAVIGGVIFLIVVTVLKFLGLL